MILENGREEKVREKSLFKEKYSKVRSTVEEWRLEEFGRLKSDEERMKFISEVIKPENLPEICVERSGKDVKSAREFKEQGNKAFAKGDFREALKCYTESIKKTPQEESADFALGLANRSAALLHLQEYELAVRDIDAALSLNYPSELRYKVFERKAKCLLALKKNPEALNEFKNTIRALDESKLQREKKMKMQTDIQIMLGVMGKSIEPASEPSSIKSEEKKAKITGTMNQIYEAASNKVEIKEDPSAGRFAAASDNISVGETLLIEKAYCSVLLPDYHNTNCHHCFKRTLAPQPCFTCSLVIFCGSACRDSAVSTYHKHECAFLETLYNSGVSVTVLMALRMISQQSLHHFLQLKDKLTEERRLVEKYKSTDYLAVYHLVRHEGNRMRDDFFERSVMALFLLHCLKKGNYFGSKKEHYNHLTEEEIFIGGLLLRHLQILQFNAHEISELEMKSERNLDSSRSLFIGGGLYPTLALFNHSCDPGIVRYFEGTKVIVRAVKPIGKGDVIAENYGPIYSQTKKKERQEKLGVQYWFQCHCQPCEEAWPTYEEMDKKTIRFRCDAREESGEKVANCGNVLVVPVDTEEFMIRCFLCKRYTNLFKGLKTLQDTDIMYKQASSLTSKGNHSEALEVYFKILTMLHDILAPPFRDFLLCQQSIRKCMLTLGNKFVVSTS